MRWFRPKLLENYGRLLTSCPAYCQLLASQPSNNITDPRAGAGPKRPEAFGLILYVVSAKPWQTSKDRVKHVCALLWPGAVLGAQRLGYVRGSLWV